MHLPLHSSVVGLHKLLGGLRRPIRLRRMQRFVTTLDINPVTRVLDVGGSPKIWDVCSIQPRVTLLNIKPYVAHMPMIVGDARRLPIKDGSFDVVFSNSLIEHLPPVSWHEFAHECRRVGTRLWIQAPNQRFPIEPHQMTPFIHWLPRRWQKRLARWSVRALADHSSRAAVRLVEEVHLPTARQLRTIFPDAQLVVERWLGLPKALIVVLDLDRAQSSGRIR